MSTGAVSTAALQEKLSALTTAHKVLILVLTVAILGVGFYFWQYKPQSERIRKLQAEVSQQQKRLDELKLAASQIDTLQKDLAQSEEELARMVALLPDQKEIPGLLENVSLLGSEVGLENILFQPQPEQPQEFYAAIPIRLDLVGTYHELGIFFDKVSKLNRILKVENLSLARQQNSPRLTVGCTIMTYRFIDKPAQPQAAKQKK